MTYALGESKARDIIVNSTSLLTAATVVSVANNTPAGYQHLLDTGAARSYVFLRPGPYRYESVTLSEYRYTWTTVVELWTREVDPGETEQVAIGIRQSMLDAFNKYEELNNMTGVYGSMITAGDAPQYMKSTKSKRMYVVLGNTLEWQEDVTPAIADV